jgi:hypothetical protein
MQVSLVDNILWAGSFIGNLALLIVLLTHKRYKQFHIFTSIVGFDIVRDVALFFIYQYGGSELYRFVYWTAFAIDFLLQVALIFEVARIVLRPTGTWVRDARLSFLIGSVAGAIIAAVLTYAVHPSAPTSFGAWGVRAFLFTSLLFCELFLVMMFAAQRLGLVWKNHVMGLGQGLTAWALVSAGVDAAHSYLGTTYVSDFKALEHIRSLAYIVAVGYWIYIFRAPEPERRPLSPDMQKYLVALHSKVQYDASKVSGTPNSR